MWVIQKLDDGQFFRGFEAPPCDDRIIWVETVEEAEPFATLEDEESYRGMNLAHCNAQPYEVSVEG
jgi:hypothetical protein